MQDTEPFVASPEDKAALVGIVLQQLGISGESEARAKRFFELLLEQPAGFDAVLGAWGEIAGGGPPRAAKRKRTSGRRFRSHSRARQIARRFDEYRKSRPGKSRSGKSVSALHKGFVATLPEHLKPRANSKSRDAGGSIKRISSLISLGGKLNRRRRTANRLAMMLLRQAGLVKPRRRDIALKIRELNEFRSETEFLQEVQQAEYLAASARLALLGGGDQGLSPLAKK